MRAQRKALILVAVLAVAASVPAAAQAGHPQSHSPSSQRTLRRLRAELAAARRARRQAVARLTRIKTTLAASEQQVASLTSQSAGLTSEVGSLSSQVVTIPSLQSENSSLQSEVASLENQHANLQGEVTGLQGQVAALQGQLAAIPTPLAAGEELIRREVASAEAELDADGITFSDPEIASLATMSYVVGHISENVYSYLLDNSLPLPKATPDSSLGLDAGECGDHALTFAAIMKHLGYSVRSVQFWYTDPLGKPADHIADEVSYGGSWHYFDPTFGLYWTDASGNVLDITTAREGGATEHKDDTLLQNVFLGLTYGGADPTGFETDPATTVVLDGQPFNC